MKLAGGAVLLLSTAIAANCFASDDPNDYLTIRNEGDKKVYVHVKAANAPPGRPFSSVLVPPDEERSIALASRDTFDVFVQWYDERNRIEEFGVRELPIRDLVRLAAVDPGEWLVEFRHWATWVGPPGRRLKVVYSRPSTVGLQLETRPGNAVLTIPKLQFVAETGIGSGHYDPPRPPVRPK